MMPSIKIKNIQVREGWVDYTLLEIVLDWINIQDQEAQARCVRYVENRAAGHDEEGVEDES